MADFREAGRILARADITGHYSLGMEGYRRFKSEIKSQIDMWAGRSIDIEEWEEANEGYYEVNPPGMTTELWALRESQEHANQMGYN